MTAQTGPKATAERVWRDLPEVRYVLEHLPSVSRRLVDQVLANDGQLPIDRQMMHKRERRQYRVIAGAAGLIAGALLVGLDAKPEWVGWAVGAVGLITLYLGRPGPPPDRNR